MNFLELCGFLFVGFFVIISGAILHDTVFSSYKKWRERRTREYLKRKIESHYKRYWFLKDNYTAKEVKEFAEDFYWSAWKNK